MSLQSDLFEKKVAKEINKLPTVVAKRPAVGTSYSDVLVTHKATKKKAWVEVKMNHRDNLANPRVFYQNGKWQTTYNTPVAKTVVDELNKSSFAKKFIKDVATFAKIDPKKVTVKSQYGKAPIENNVPFETMKAYWAKHPSFKYILHIENYNLGKLATEHYTLGKEEPADYMQAGDDFYMIGKANPFNLPKEIPLLTGTGSLRVRISFDEKYKLFEVQAEIRIYKLPDSNYSVLNPNKKNPFATLH